MHMQEVQGSGSQEAPSLWCCPSAKQVTCRHSHCSRDFRRLSRWEFCRGSGAGGQGCRIRIGRQRSIGPSPPRLSIEAGALNCTGPRTPFEQAFLGQRKSSECRFCLDGSGDGHWRDGLPIGLTVFEAASSVSKTSLQRNWLTFLVGSSPAPSPYPAWIPVPPPAPPASGSALPGWPQQTLRIPEVAVLLGRALVGSGGFLPGPRARRAARNPDPEEIPLGDQDTGSQTDHRAERTGPALWVSNTRGQDDLVRVRKNL